MLVQLAATLALATSASALNILLTNDDSWASANIRQAYFLQKGHLVLTQVLFTVQHSVRCKRTVIMSS